METLILTPNKTEMCGMYQLAKALAKELDADIGTKLNCRPLCHNWQNYNEVITFFYPMHKFGKQMKVKGVKWICYDQKIPPVTKEYFPDFFRRQYMRWFAYVNNKSMQGADKYWELSEIEQKPRWIKKINLLFFTYQGVDLTKPYFIYTGRTKDYKNFKWLKQLMDELNIPFIHPVNESDEVVHSLLSNAFGYATASIWEGYGRGVMEAYHLGIFFICFDTGTHNKYRKNGIVVPNKDFNTFKKVIKKVWADEKN